MASAKAPRKPASVTAPVPNCPICMEMMTAPIFQCKVGHSLCSTCNSNLPTPLCPICRQDMTQMRNWQLEEMVAKVQVACSNKPAGCVYTMPTADLPDHLKECIFRTMECPIGAAFGLCSWTGQLKELMQHFKDRHPFNCDVNNDEIRLNNIKVTQDERSVHITNQGKFIFIITFKIDTIQKMAYWAIQNIGSKKAARQYIYEIQVISKEDPRKKVVFTDHCFNDVIKADEVFKTGKCPMLPLCSLAHFVKDNELTFKFSINRTGPPALRNWDGKREGNQRNSDDKRQGNLRNSDDNRQGNQGNSGDKRESNSNQGFKNRGQNPKGPSGPKPKGQGGPNNNQYKN